MEEEEKKEENKYYTSSDEYLEELIKKLNNASRMDKFMFLFSEAADEIRPKHKKVASFIDRIINKYTTARDVKAAKDEDDIKEEESNDKPEK